MKGRRTALLLDNTVSVLALVIPRGAMITSLSTAQPLLTVALRHRGSGFFVLYMYNIEPNDVVLAAPGSLPA